MGFLFAIGQVVQNFNQTGTSEYSMFLGSSLDMEVGLSFGYICAIMLFAKSKEPKDKI